MANAAILLAALVAGAALALLFRRRTAPPESEQVLRDLHRTLQDQIDRLEASVRRLKEATAEADRRRAELEALLKTPPAPAPAAADPLHERVWRLRDEGRDPAAIAAETGLEPGEVSLILGLRNLR